MTQPQPVIQFPQLMVPAPPAAPAVPQQQALPFPTFQPVVDWAARARKAIAEKVHVGANRPTTPEQIEWCFNTIKVRLGTSPSSITNMDERIAMLLEGTSSFPLDDPSAPPVSVAPPAQPAVDPRAAIIALLPTKLTHKGAPCTGTPEMLGQMVDWLAANFKGVPVEPSSPLRLGAILAWMQALPAAYELDDETRLQRTQQPPANPISTQTAPQVAQPAAVVPPEDDTPSGEILICPVCKTESKSVRGMKRHVSMTHKADWSTFTKTYSLDAETGRPTGAAPVGTPSTTPTVAPPPSPAMPPMLGQPGATALPVLTPPPAAAVPMFTPPPAPAPAQAQVMPTPPAVQPMAPIAPVVTPAWNPAQGFQPAAPASTAAAPAGPQPMPVVTAFQPPPVMQPIIQVPAAQPITQPPAPQMMAPAAGMTRAELAQALGGAVTLTMVRMLDAAQIQLAGMVDANQLAHLAEQQARQECKVMDLAESSYGKGKQTAQRIFGQLLTRCPHVFILMNGYDSIIPDGYIEILAARTLKLTIITDQGRSATDITFA